MYKDLCKQFCDMNGCNKIEDGQEFIIDGISYTSEEIETLQTIDQGKYQIGGTIYGIRLSEEENNFYTLFYIRQGFIQTGSYYSYQERTYEKPERIKKVTKTITDWECY